MNSDIFIYQKYKGETIPLVLSKTQWQVHTLVILTTLACISIVMLIICILLYYQKTKKYQTYKPLRNNTICKPSPKVAPSLSITATELIYEHFNYDQNLINLTFIDYGGYVDIPKLGPLIELKNKYEFHLKKIRVSFNLLIFVLIGSLLFAAHCGVIFLIQNDQYQRKYSIPFTCDYETDNDIFCMVREEMSFLLKDAAKNGTYTLYNDFYEDIMHPYMARHGQNLDVDASLYVLPQQQDFISDLKYRTEFGYTIDGLMYLGANSWDDSDFQFVSVEEVGGDEFRLDNGDNGYYIHRGGCWCCDCSCWACLSGIMIVILLIIVIYGMKLWCNGEAIMAIHTGLINQMQPIMDEISYIENKWKQ
eukprot:276003_1